MSRLKIYISIYNMEIFYYNTINRKISFLINEYVWEE